MKLTRRTGLLLGALGVGLVVLLVDRLAGAGPRTAAADPTASQPVAPTWEDTALLDARLNGRRYEPVADDFAQLTRDLFVPTAIIEAELESQAPPEPDPAPEPEPAPAPSFADTHQLVGIMRGPHPLAVVGDQLVPLQAELDGHILVAVERACAVFEERSTGLRVTLSLQERGATASAPADPR